MLGPRLHKGTEGIAHALGSSLLDTLHSIDVDMLNLFNFWTIKGLKLLKNRIPESLIVNKYSVLNGSVFTHYEFHVLIPKFLLVVKLENIIQFSCSDESIMLLINLIYGPHNIYHLIVTMNYSHQFTL